MAHNNKVRDGVADLAGKTFTPAQVRDDPKICTGRAQGHSIKESKEGTSAVRGGGEGGSLDLGSFESGDVYHSRHACREC